MEKIEEVTTIKELTGLLSQQLNEIVSETFGDFPKLIVYATRNSEGDPDPKNIKSYDLDVVFAPLQIDSVGPIENSTLTEVLNWSKNWLGKVLD